MDYPYKDPTDKQLFEKIKNELQKADNYYNLKRTIDKYFKGWITYELKEYSADIPRFTQNWESLVGMIGTEKREIIVVQLVCVNEKAPQTELLRLAAEKLTKMGCVVRSVMELKPCDKCCRALPTEKIHTYLKLSHPYTGKCSNC